MANPDGLVPFFQLFLRDQGLYSVKITSTSTCLKKYNTWCSIVLSGQNKPPSIYILLSFRHDFNR